MTIAEKLDNFAGLDDMEKVGWVDLLGVRLGNFDQMEEERRGGREEPEPDDFFEFHYEVVSKKVVAWQVAA